MTHISSSQATEAPVSRMQVMLQAKNCLPADMRSLFQDLYVLNKSEAQIQQERGLTQEQILAQTESMMRALKTAVA